MTATFFTALLSILIAVCWIGNVIQLVSRFNQTRRSKPGLFVFRILGVFFWPFTVGTILYRGPEDKFVFS